MRLPLEQQSSTDVVAGRKQALEARTGVEPVWTACKGFLVNKITDLHGNLLFAPLGLFLNVQMIRRERVFWHRSFPLQRHVWDLQAKPATGLDHTLVVAARTASTSYRITPVPETLAEMLASGDAPDEYRPHLMTFLDETPLPVVIKAIQEAAQRSPATTPRKVRQGLAKWADELHS